jgi:hypothetical protein
LINDKNEVAAYKNEVAAYKNEVAVAAVAAPSPRG